MLKPSLFLCLLTATAVQADCALDQDHFSSCKIQGQEKWVFVCYNDDFVTYSYGPDGGPAELTISDTIADADYHPWSGVGRDIGESVTFHNDGYSYDVVMGFSRTESTQTDENGNFYPEVSHYGWISVALGAEEIARLACDPNKVSYGFGGGIYDVKVAQGYHWDNRARVWLQKPQ